MGGREHKVDCLRKDKEIQADTRALMNEGWRIMGGLCRDNCSRLATTRLLCESPRETVKVKTLMAEKK